MTLLWRLFVGMPPFHLSNANFFAFLQAMQSHFSKCTSLLVEHCRIIIYARITMKVITNRYASSIKGIYRPLEVLSAFL